MEDTVAAAIFTYEVDNENYRMTSASLYSPDAPRWKSEKVVNRARRHGFFSPRGVMSGR